MLACANQIEVFPLYFIHHGIHFCLAHDALNHISADHKRRDAVGKALSNHKIPGISQHALMEPGDIAYQVIEPISGDPSGGIHINPMEPLHNFSVVRDFKLWDQGFPKPFLFHIGAVIRPNGYRGVNYIRNDHQDMMDFLLQFTLPLFQFSQLVSVCFHLCLYSFRFLQLGGIFFCLPHQHAHLFAQRIPLCSQLACFGDRAPVFFIQD